MSCAHHIGKIFSRKQGASDRQRISTPCMDAANPEHKLSWILGWHLSCIYCADPLTDLNLAGMIW